MEYVTVTDMLDLHGTPIKIIPEMIEAFIENAVELQLSRVQIIHGKGKSRLKYLTRQLLNENTRVITYYDAHPKFGGWGRTVVELDVTMNNSRDT